MKTLAFNETERTTINNNGNGERELDRDETQHFVLCMYSIHAREPENDTEKKKKEKKQRRKTFIADENLCARRKPKRQRNLLIEEFERTLSPP